MKNKMVSNLVDSKKDSYSLVTRESISPCLPQDKPEYKQMIANIAENLPAIRDASSNFHKSHSQFMAVTVDVTALTPIRAMKFTLAEIENTKTALTEAYFNSKKVKIKLERWERKLQETEDFFERQMLELKIERMQVAMEHSKELVGGAVRKINSFINQYNNLLTHVKKEGITEEEYEKEEVKYHIMTALKQALISARASGGRIDEGNHIYLFELGINGAQAQLELDAYLHTEMELLKEGKAPTHEMTLQWMEALTEKWADNPRIFAERRGFSLLDEQSLVNYVPDEILKEAG
jgi:hypothetical protein